jgi:opacity protein-like surface antigen
MKRILLALAGAFTITLSASTYAAEPLSFGIKVGAVNSSIAGLDKAKTLKVDSESKFFNLGAVGTAYAEYAFTDNVGIGVEAGYFFGQIGSFKPKNVKDSKDVYNITAHGVKLIPAIKFYPMGREDENGILKIHVGADLYIPVAAEGKQEGATKKNTTIDRNDLTKLGAGVIGGVGYEFPFGLELDLRYSYAFTNVFTETSSFKNTVLEITDKDDKTALMGINFAVGYNFAVLLEE